MKREVANAATAHCREKKMTNQHNENKERKNAMLVDGAKRQLYSKPARTQGMKKKE